MKRLDLFDSPKVLPAYIFSCQKRFQSCVKTEKKICDKESFFPLCACLLVLFLCCSCVRAKTRADDSTSKTEKISQRIRNSYYEISFRAAPENLQKTELPCSCATQTKPIHEKCRRIFDDDASRTLRVLSAYWHVGILTCLYWKESTSKRNQTTNARQHKNKHTHLNKKIRVFS